MTKFFGGGSNHHVLVCNKCGAEHIVGKLVPYKVECPNGCGAAKTTYKVDILFSNGGLHHMVVVSTTSKKYVQYEKWKEKQ